MDFLLFYIIIKKMNHQITENEEILFLGKNAQVSLVTLSDYFKPSGFFFCYKKVILTK